MQVLIETEFQTIFLHEELNALEQRFKPKSKEIFGDRYMTEIEHLGKLLDERAKNGIPCKNLIINTINGGPAMSPKVQDYMQNEFYERIAKAGVTTKAYCLGPDVIAKISVEMTAEEDSNAFFKFNFFNTLEDGIQWLKKQ